MHGRGCGATPSPTYADDGAGTCRRRAGLTLRHASTDSSLGPPELELCCGASSDKAEVHCGLADHKDWQGRALRRPGAGAGCRGGDPAGDREVRNCPGAPGPDRSSANRYRVMSCPHCRDTGWVCEEHPNKPMDHEGCTGAGMPCICNRADAEHSPALPPGFRVDRDKDGSRH